jgi:protein-disulfide isomerase
MKRTEVDELESARLTIPVSKRDHIQGPLNAPMNLVEYGDYECPFCANAHSIVKAVQKHLGDKLCFAYRNFPLANAHPHAEHAAEAAEAAGAQGNFWGMQDLLFENQDALEDYDLAEYASELNLDVPRLIREVEAGTHARRVKEDFMSGVRSGVNGTPSFFINGTRYDGGLGLDGLLSVLK